MPNARAMIAASWTCRVSRSLGVQNDSSRPVPMRIQRAQTRTVWPEARSSERMVPANESRPRIFGSGLGGVGEVGGVGGVGVRGDGSAFADGWATAFHSCAMPSQYHLPSGETRWLGGFHWVLLMTCLPPQT